MKNRPVGRYPQILPASRPSVKEFPVRRTQDCKPDTFGPEALKKPAIPSDSIQVGVSLMANQSLWIR